MHGYIDGTFLVIKLPTQMSILFWRKKSFITNVTEHKNP
jgi:hypothetical protein